MQDTYRNKKADSKNIFTFKKDAGNIEYNNQMFNQGFGNFNSADGANVASESIDKNEDFKYSDIKEDIDREILDFKNNINLSNSLEEIEDLITSLSDGTLEDILMISFNDATANHKDISEIKEIILNDLDIELEDNADYYNESFETIDTIKEEIINQGAR